MSATVQASFKQKIVESIEIPVFTRCCFCFPLRKGLITFAYIYLALAVMEATFIFIYLASDKTVPDMELVEFPRLVVEVTAIMLELIMTIAFIVALHKKHVLLMKIYLYFEIVLSLIGLVYSLAYLTKETASELFVILFQLVMQIYLVILIWSSIVKMERDGTVKYTRDRDPA